MAKLYPLLMILFLVSCGSNPKIPSHYYSTSEATGAGQNKASLGVGVGYKLVFSDSLVSQTVTENVAVDEELDFRFSYSRGLFPSFDLETDFGSDQPLYLGGKYMLYGNGTFSTSVRLGSSIYIASEVVNGNNSNGETTERFIIISGYVMNSEFLIGYKFFGALLTYMMYGYQGYSYVTDFVEGDLDQELKIEGDHGYYGIGLDYSFGTVSSAFILTINEFNVDEYTSQSKSGLTFSLTGSVKF